MIHRNSELDQDSTAPQHMLYSHVILLEYTERYAYDNAQKMGIKSLILSLASCAMHSAIQVIFLISCSLSFKYA